MTTSRSSLGEVSRSTTVAASPVSACARSAAFAIVAEASRNGGRRRTRERAGAVAEHVRDMRPEDAAVDVGLVDDDEAEVVEHVPQRSWCGSTPTWSMSGFVRIRFDHFDLPARLRRRVAVVDRGLEPLQAERGERAGLVLGERLRRVQVQRARIFGSCAIASRTGRLNASDFPDAVPVVTITFSPVEPPPMPPPAVERRRRRRGARRRPAGRGRRTARVAPGAPARARDTRPPPLRGGRPSPPRRRSPRLQCRSRP